MLTTIKGWVKNQLYEKLNLPSAKFGLPITLLRHIPKHEGMVIVDVGAWEGNFTRAVDAYCGVRRAILIEPLPEKALELKKRFQAPKYEVFECAISSEAGIIDFEVNSAKDTSSILKIKRDIPELAEVELGLGKIIQRPAYTLDSIVEKTILDHVDLLKIDVQGAEHLVIRGANKTLAKTSIIWTEVSFKPLYSGSATFNEIYLMLTRIGFKLIDMSPIFRAPDGELLQSDALFVR